MKPTLAFTEEHTVHLGPTTHWTITNAEHCSDMRGVFKTTPIEAAKEAFEDTHYCADNGPTDYIDGEKLLCGAPYTVKVWGLTCVDNRYYWTGDTKQVVFTLNVFVD